MLRRVACVCLSLVLTTRGIAQAQPAPLVKDREVAKGIRQGQEGDYESAILTLDAAANRLAAAGGQVSDLTQAYVYLGIAYLAKNHQTAALARFRDALAQTPSLRLRPDEFPPRVIELFEQARQEAGRTALSPTSGPATANKGGGSRKGLVLAGAGLAAAAGIGLAVAGGGGGEGTTSGDRRTETFTGTLAAGGDDHFNVIARDGIIDATLSTTEARTRPRLSVTAGSLGGTLVAQIAGPLAQVSATVTAGTYFFHVENSGERVPMPYTLTVIYP